MRGDPTHQPPLRAAHVPAGATPALVGLSLAALIVAACSLPVVVEQGRSGGQMGAPPSASPAARSDGPTALGLNSASRAVAAGTERPAVGAESGPIASIEPRPWVFQGHAGRVHETANARIHSTLPEGSLDRALPAFIERTIHHYQTALVDLPPLREPMETFIFGTRSQWELLTRERLGRAAAPYLAMGKGGFTTEGDAILYDIGPLDTLTIVAHEGWHQYTQRTFRNPLPLWLEEGIACWMEAVRPGRGQSASSPFMPWRNHERFSELRNGMRRGDMIPLEELLDSTPEQFLRQGKDRMLLYYAQVWALIHFLREGEGGRYEPALRELLLDAAEGRLIPRMTHSPSYPNPTSRTLHLHSRVGKWVALEYFNPRFAEFKEQYERFLDEITRPGTGGRVWQGESPLSRPSSG